MTNIEWTDVTDNVITVEGGGWWCRKISSGCINCYAAKLNQNSFYGGNHLPYTGNPPNLILKRDILQSWSKMRSPKKHFVASMTDVFGEWVPRGWQFEFLDAMQNSPKQTFQLLTKRPEIMKNAIADWCRDRRIYNSEFPPNIWLGTTVESQDYLWRLEHLAQTPASVQFVSFEPLLGEINGAFDRVAGSRIKWAIVGGESGKNARYCHLDWMRSLVSQCQVAGVAPFVKQLGYRAIDGGQKRETRGITKGQIIVTREGEDGTAYWYYDNENGVVINKKGNNVEAFPKELQIREFPI